MLWNGRQSFASQFLIEFFLLRGDTMSWHLMEEACLTFFQLFSSIVFIATCQICSLDNWFPGLGCKCFLLYFDMNFSYIILRKLTWHENMNPKPSLLHDKPRWLMNHNFSEKVDLNKINVPQDTYAFPVFWYLYFLSQMPGINPSHLWLFP